MSVAVASMEEAVALGIEESLTVIEGHWGKSIGTTFIENIVVLVGLGASPESVDKIVSALIKNQNWMGALAVANAAGRELSPQEIDAVFLATSELKDLVGLATALGNPSEAAVLKLAKRDHLKILESGYYRKIIALCPTEAVVKEAIMTCIRSKLVNTALDIAKDYGCSDDTLKEQLREAGIRSGSIKTLKAVDKTILDREPTPEEIVQTCRVSAYLAKQ